MSRVLQGMAQFNVSCRGIATEWITVTDSQRGIDLRCTEGYLGEGDGPPALFCTAFRDCYTFSGHCG